MKLTDEQRKNEISAMSRKELNAHAFLLEQEQERYEIEIKQLREENERMRKQLVATRSVKFSRMKAALRNILDMSQDDFARHQAAYGLEDETRW